VIVRTLLALGVLCLGGAFWLRTRAKASGRSTDFLVVSSTRSRPTESDRLRFSVDGLREAAPDLSADHTLSPSQRAGGIIALTVAIAALFVLWRVVLLIILATATIVYFASMLLRIRLFQLALNGKGITRIDDDEARAFPVDELPSYSVLVPAFREPQVCERLVANLRHLDYPADRIEILLLLEEDDSETIDAARRAIGNANDVRVVLVPDHAPRTKPKALNYGLTHSRGSLITIYDAEDRPDPLQLRKAAIALDRAPHDVACVQAELAFFNPTQNLITRWFTIEYSMWFKQLLPGLAQLDAPIPLGGTSNHFRREVLFELNAWDPFNVTEDADLGVRMRRAGYRSGVIDSVTFEEANSDFINWVKQRSRWYKGYAQTLLVHLRHPRTLYRQIGLRELILFCLFVGGTPLLALLNPFFWFLMMLWWVAHPALLDQLMPTAVYFMGLVCFVAGNFIFAYMCMLSVRHEGPRQWLAALLVPLYWVMMSIAAIKAATQILVAPSFWEKTTHGLDVDLEAQSAANPASEAVTP
jgi:cellulose synthase/poly-beta-1,6-N-acetylglucosamine synthase-like glycosyltransferase